MTRQSNKFQRKEHDKISEKELNETQRSNQPDKKFKEIIIQMLSDLSRNLVEHNENLNKDTENIRK